MLDVVQGTPEWRAARLGLATASRMDAVMAKGRSGNPSATRDNYIAQLVVERLTGVSVDSYTNAAMERGTELEPEARAAYEFQAGVTVKEAGFVPHPYIANTGGSPDGLVGDDGLIEIKCPNMATHLATVRSGEIARGYVLQIQWCMAVTGRQWCDFVSYDPRFPLELQLKIIRVPRDNGLIAEMTGAVKAFLAEVDAAVAELSLKEAA